MHRVGAEHSLCTTAPRVESGGPPIRVVDTAEHGLGDDEERFFMFVKSLDHYRYENRLDEAQLREKIVAAVVRNHGYEREGAEKALGDRVGEAWQILDFLNATREFPDPEVEGQTPPLE